MLWSNLRKSCDGREIALRLRSGDGEEVIGADVQVFAQSATLLIHGNSG
jgi:hypothetical protein